MVQKPRKKHQEYYSCTCIPCPLIRPTQNGLGQRQSVTSTPDHFVDFTPPRVPFLRLKLLVPPGLFNCLLECIGTKTVREESRVKILFQ